MLIELLLSVLIQLVIFLKKGFLWAHLRQNAILIVAG